jgi:hypothetical protein
MRGVGGGTIPLLSHLSSAVGDRQTDRQTHCFHFISGVPPNWRTARCCRPRNISFVQRKWKLKIESYIQWTTDRHTVDCAARPERCCTRSSRSYTILQAIYVLYVIYLMYLTQVSPPILSRCMPLKPVTCLIAHPSPFGSTNVSYSPKPLSSCSL